MVALTVGALSTFASTNSDFFIYDGVQHHSHNFSCSERLAGSVNRERADYHAGDKGRIGIVAVVGLAGIDAIAVSAGGCDSSRIAATCLQSG